MDYRKRCTSEDTVSDPLIIHRYLSDLINKRIPPFSLSFGLNNNNLRPCLSDFICTTIAH